MPHCESRVYEVFLCMAVLDTEGREHVCKITSSKCRTPKSTIKFLWTCLQNNPFGKKNLKKKHFRETPTLSFSLQSGKQSLRCQIHTNSHLTFDETYFTQIGDACEISHTIL